MASPLLVEFAGWTEASSALPSRQWRALAMTTVAGPPIDEIAWISLTERPAIASPGARWALRGVVSHQRYVERTESDALKAVQPGLGRPEATMAALIPIKKSPAWWDLAQDERRMIFEHRSRHVASTMRFLPAIARRLHHARDLGEPFDFLTWFEYAPEHTGLFEDLLGMLRATEEWSYVEREVDIRLSRDPAK